MTYSIPRRLSRPEAAAVRHLLRYSALGSCVGTPNRIWLTDTDDLVMRDLDGWRWSGGEHVLLEVLLHILGQARWPDISKVDEHEQLIVREALRLLTREPVS